MNIILDTPLPTSVISKRSYDNKILLIFLALMIFLITTGLFLLDANGFENTVNPQSPANTQESQDTPQYPMFS
ncbi:hypothetical protein HYW43_00240 [Candidatus Daviesbacteria bacterium]|nr:hypothetical protein [Candidatus Daviesbacteria bacterium]